MWEQDERLKCAGMQSTQQDEDEETAGLMCVEATEFEFNSGFKELWEDREIDIYYCITLFFWQGWEHFPAGAQMSDDQMGLSKKVIRYNFYTTDNHT